MIYREYLVIRKALAWFAGVLAIVLVLVALSWRNGTSDYAGITVTSGWLAMLFASIVGVALGNGSREAARVLWVIPTERWKLALQVIAVDLAGVSVAFVLAFAGQGLTMNMRGTVGAADIVMAVVMAYAVYGWSAVLGMLGRRMAYCGVISLPVLIAWFSAAQSPNALGGVLRAPVLANPLAVFNTTLAINGWQNHHFSLDPVSLSLQWLGTSWETPVLVAISAATCAVAVAVWQRAEAIC
jgi:membrane-bound metal-dependent hydrolase YbcI (DUF457 family)